MPNLRHEREQLRKDYWAFIAAIRRDRPEDLEGLTADEVIGKTGVDVNRVHLLLEIIVNGDGGSFTNDIIQPIFHFLAREVT